MRFSPRFLRTVRRVLLILVSIATLLALIVAIENWRGSRAWSKYAAEQAARGVNLLELPKPSTVPDDVNFMKTPTLDRFLWEKSRSFFSDYALPQSYLSKSRGWRTGSSLDYTLCIASFTDLRKENGLQPIEPASTQAATLLKMMQPVDSVLDELRQAARERAASQLSRPVEIKPESPFGAPVARFAVVRSIAHTLSYHACASLEGNHTDTAVLDTLAALRLCRGLADAPDNFLVETMASAVCYSPAVQPIWEGLQRRAWTDEQLGALQQELSKTDLVRSLDRAYSNERAAALVMFDRSTVGKLLQIRRMKWLRMPRGWHQQNKVVYCQIFDRFHDGLSSQGTPQFLDKVAHIGDLPTPGFGVPFSPYSFLAARSMPVVHKVTRDVVQKQTFLNLALVACALERHRLAHSDYPATLSELVPSYLDRIPLDIVDGQPLRYRRTDDGRFRLYSIGLDGKDDNGSPASANRLDAPGDWCWPNPPEASVARH